MNLLFIIRYVSESFSKPDVKHIEHNHAGGVDGTTCV